MQQIEPLINGKFYHIYNRGINSCDLFREPTNYEHFLNLYDNYISPIAYTYAWVLMKNHFHLFVQIREDVVYKYSNADYNNTDRYKSTNNTDRSKDMIKQNETIFINSCINNTDRSKDAVRLDAAKFEEIKWETTDLSDLSACIAPDSIVEATKEAPDRVVENNLKIPKAHLHFSHLFNAYSKYFNTYTGRHGVLFERPFKRKEITAIAYFKALVVYIHNNPEHHQFTEHAMDYPWSSYLTCISIKPTHLQHDVVIGWFDNAANFKMSHQNAGDATEIEELLRL